MIRTSTVHEELIENVSNEIVFVDVNENDSFENQLNEEKNNEKYSTANTQAKSSPIFFENQKITYLNDGFSEKDISPTVAFPEIPTPKNKSFAVKKRRTINLTDADDVKNEFFFKSD